MKQLAPGITRPLHATPRNIGLLTICVYVKNAAPRRICKSFLMFLPIYVI